jgi:hypothetical protein
MTDQNKLNELQSKLDRNQDINLRRVSDMGKLKSILERLRCDLQVLILSKKLNQEESVDNQNIDG